MNYNGLEAIYKTTRWVGYADKMHRKQQTIVIELLATEQFTPSTIIAGKQVGRHMFLAAVRAHSRKADRGYPGSQEPEEDGRWRTVW